MNKQRILFRQFPFNRLTFPLLLNIWEKTCISPKLDIRITQSADAESLMNEVPDLDSRDVLIYSFMTPHLPLIAEEIKAIRKSIRKTRLPLFTAGGPHVTGEQSLAFEIGLDRIFAGPAENTFLQFGQDLLNGSISKEKTILPPSGTEDLNDYLPISSLYKGFPPLEIMRGCFWNCRYCQTGTKKPSFRSYPSIQDYLEQARKRKFKRITFISPSSLEWQAIKPGQPDLEKLSEFLELIHSYGFRFREYGVFPSEIRPDSVTPQSMGILKKYVTNRHLTLGGQNSTDSGLKSINRGHTAADIENAILYATAEGFKVNLDFIVAYPDETEEDRKASLEYLIKMNRKYQVKIYLHHFFPVSGSAFSNRLPSFLSPREKERFLALSKNGIATSWWLEGEKNAKDYLRWLQKNFPETYRKYH
ncbi:MAG: radical SAM protein [Candidatus Aureabacteria bacterium]|nr:radical SAM protein [Candidatus Auribacterota bacterium]